MSVSLRSVPVAAREGANVPERPETFEEFFSWTHQRLFGALCLVTGNRHEAEEIMQDAYLKIWERWQQVESMEDPVGFLFRTAMNVFRSRYRRTVVAMRRTVALAPRADDLLVVEDRDEVVRALRRLAPAERASIVLTTMCGYSSEEAGRLLGVKASTVRAHATRARAAVRARMGKRS